LIQTPIKATRPVIEIPFVKLPTGPIPSFNDSNLSDDDKPATIWTRNGPPDIQIYTTASSTSPKFVESRQKELQRLLEKGVFQIVNLEDVPRDSRIFKTRFVDKIKFASTTRAYDKSCLVVQGYSDTDKTRILTQAPTIQQASQQILLALAPSLIKDRHIQIYLRDISQAYIQSRQPLIRNVYTYPTTEFNLPENKILQIVMLLYGLAESGAHWFETYYKHHLTKLDIVESTFDLYLLVEKSGYSLVRLQTDDSLILADSALTAREQAELTFISKL
jgi:hypothetical protein